MPLTRYQIRNEYSLADPELYRAADKDDPEALLEGVAMAGLVGVLRQLGDLAEFAAEIFHDLHEEVMATATRGHRLTIRIQQLEAEFPSVEKAILSQTSHTSFIHNAGVDWHPNRQMDQNLITRGDLPRFIMDSYEECRGPPRLFLLDKFDIAGAGACLKRYSDPSFFKAEFTTLKSTKSEDKKEKRSRKTKKKVLRSRNGETAEVIQTSHSKLHDLFLEESNQTEDKNVHKHRVRLKRRLSNCSLVDSTTRKSYMERILDGYLLNGKVVSGSSASSLQSKREHNSGELVPEIHEIHMSPTSEKKVQEASLDKLDGEIIKEGILEELPKSTHDIELEDTLSTICEAEDQKELVVDGERKIEANTDGYRSDDVTSEIDNYVDALTTMESEMETDTEGRPRIGQGFIIEKKWMDSNINEEHREIQAQFSDSHSIGSSLASDDGTHSLRKGRLSLSYSGSIINLPDNVLSDGDAEAKVFPSTETFPVEIVDLSAEKNSDILSVSGSRSLTSTCVVPNGTCNEVAETPRYVSEFEEKTFNSYIAESTSAPSNVPEACASDIQPVGPHSSEISSDIVKSVTEVSLSNVGETGENGSVNISDLPSLARDGVLSVGFHGEQAVEMLKGGKPDASYDATTQPSGILDLAHEKADANHYTSEEFLHVCDVEDGSVENLEEDKHDLPASVAYPMDHCFAEQESEACSVARSLPEHIPDSPTKSDWDDMRPGGIVAETENALQNGKQPECLTSVLHSPETAHLPEKKFMETTDEVPHLQLDLAEVGTDNTEIEGLDEPAYEVSDCVIKDGSALDKVHLDCCDDEKNNDLSLDFSYRCTVSDSTEPELAAENHRLRDISSRTIHAVVDDNDTLLNRRSTDISSGEQKKFEVNEFSSLKFTERITEQKEAEYQSTVFPSDDNLVLSYQESDRLSASPLIDKMHSELLAEGGDKHSQLGDGSQLFSSSLDGKQESELEQSLSVGTENCVSVSTHLLPEQEVLEMPSDQHSGSCQVGESPESSYKQYERREFPNLSDGFSSAPPKSFPVDTPSVQSDTLPHRPVFGLLPPDHNDLGAKVQDTPPLPPLPPLQWRIGKFQHGSLFSGGMMPQQSLNPFSAAPTATADAIAQRDFPALGGELLQYPNPFLPSPAPHNEKTQNVSQVSQTEMMLPNVNPTSLVPDLKHETSQCDYQVLEPTAAQHQNPFLTQENERTEYVCLEIGGEMSSNVKISPLVSEGELGQPISPQAPIPREEEKLGHTSQISGEDVVQHPDSSAPATVGNENSQHVSRGSEGESASQSDISADTSTLEIGKPNGSLKAWLARPRDPLIEAVASHNKSNLRKVGERGRPQTRPRVDERDSLLEQIRTKSFNLKPATATRPSIHGPKTNLKVVAILEKANAIRQALAGSDEDDDEDNWSDS